MPPSGVWAWRAYTLHQDHCLCWLGRKEKEIQQISSAYDVSSTQARAGYPRQSFAVLVKGMWGKRWEKCPPQGSVEVELSYASLTFFQLFVSLAGGPRLNLLSPVLLLKWYWCWPNLNKTSGGEARTFVFLQSCPTVQPWLRVADLIQWH